MTAGVAFSDAACRAPAWAPTPPTTTAPGAASLVVGTLTNEMIALYHNEGGGLFIDDAPTSAIGPASMQTLTFATLFVDVDSDGRPDILAVNGHVADDITAVQPKIRHAQPPHLFRNLGNKCLELIGDKVGPASGSAPPQSAAAPPAAISTATAISTWC